MTPETNIANRSTAVPQGFRPTFRDWAGEETDYPGDVIEAALANVIRNRVKAA